MAKAFIRGFEDRRIVRNDLDSITERIECVAEWQLHIAEQFIRRRCRLLVVYWLRNCLLHEFAGRHHVLPESDLKRLANGSGEVVTSQSAKCHCLILKVSLP